MYNKYQIIKRARNILQDPLCMRWTDDTLTTLFNCARVDLKIHFKPTYDEDESAKIINHIITHSDHESTPPIRQKTSDYFRALINAQKPAELKSSYEIYYKIKTMLLENDPQCGILAVSLINAELMEE